MRNLPAPQRIEWEPPLRRQLRARRRPIFRASALALTCLGLAAFLDFVVHPAPRLVWNASASAPIGLWRIHPGTAFHTGDMVLLHAPDSVRTLAAQRHYLPANLPLLKRVVARDGDMVCADGPVILVNGKPVAMRRKADRVGRALPWWQGCEALKDGRVFLLMPAPDSYDGRYFGPVSESRIIGTASPLWLR